jgi:hypothetical protein
MELADISDAMKRKGFSEYCVPVVIIINRQPTPVPMNTTPLAVLNANNFANNYHGKTYVLIS